MILPKSFKLLSIFALLALAPTYGDESISKRRSTPWSKRKGTMPSSLSRKIFGLLPSGLY